MTTEQQNSLAVSKLYPNHYNQNNVENRASYYEFGLFAETMFIDNIIEIQYNDINNVMSGSNICCEFYLIPKIYFAFVFVVDVYWVLFAFGYKFMRSQLLVQIHIGYLYICWSTFQTMCPRSICKVYSRRSSRQVCRGRECTRHNNF